MRPFPDCENDSRLPVVFEPDQPVEAQSRTRLDRLAIRSDEARHAGEKWDLCFSNSVGKSMEPRDDWADWKWLCEASGVRDARLHDARHTAATLLLEQGVDIRVVQEILGHSTSTVTRK